jgi:hypothetical protein
MSFLSPYLLFALPLAALPVIIHMIHLHRRRTVPWAATMFLLLAQKMNRGFSKLRQFLILAARVLAVLGLIFVMSRPLAGGWLGLTGGSPDTVLVLLDRSASMEQQNLTTGISKRSAALTKMADGIEEMFGSNTKVVLIDSATNAPTEISNVKAMVDVPVTAATDSTADLPAMLQAALDYLTANSLGRTDIWIASDLRQSDWNATGGRWEALRAAFAKMEAVRFHVLAFPEVDEKNLSVSVENLTRRETADKAELMFDIRLRRANSEGGDAEVPMTLVVNGARSSLSATLKETELLIQGHTISIDKALKRGWGRVELPADASASDNRFHFVFDVPVPPLSVIISDDSESSDPAKAALSAAGEGARKQEVKVLSATRASEIDWDRTGLIVWQAALPESTDLLAQQLLNHVAQGRSVLFMPPSGAVNQANFMGLSWGEWRNLERKKEQSSAVEWWRTSDGLLANARSGQVLPLGELEVSRYRQIIGEGVTLARLADGESMLVQASSNGGGLAAFLATTPSSAGSSLARDGVVWFAMLQRALVQGGKGLGNALQREAGVRALQADLTWSPVEDAGILSSLLALRSGIVTSGDRSTALNRPLTEDAPLLLSDETLAELFQGLQFHRVDDSVDSGEDLANEVWRTFLLLMAAALLLEAFLCLPKRKAPSPEARMEGMAS